MQLLYIGINCLRLPVCARMGADRIVWLRGRLLFFGSWVVTSATSLLFSVSPSDWTPCNWTEPSWHVKEVSGWKKTTALVPENHYQHKCCNTSALGAFPYVRAHMCLLRLAIIIIMVIVLRAGITCWSALSDKWHVNYTFVCACVCFCACLCVCELWPAVRFKGHSSPLSAPPSIQGQSVKCPDDIVPVL